MQVLEELLVIQSELLDLGYGQSAQLVLAAQTLQSLETVLRALQYPEDASAHQTDHHPGHLDSSSQLPAVDPVGHTGDRQAGQRAIGDLGAQMSFQKEVRLVFLCRPGSVLLDPGVDVRQVQLVQNLPVPFLLLVILLHQSGVVLHRLLESIEELPEFLLLLGHVSPHLHLATLLVRVAQSLPNALVTTGLLHLYMIRCVIITSALRKE